MIRPTCASLHLKSTPASSLTRAPPRVRLCEPIRHAPPIAAVRERVHLCVQAPMDVHAEVIARAVGRTRKKDRGIHDGAGDRTEVNVPMRRNRAVQEGRARLRSTRNKTKPNREDYRRTTRSCDGEELPQEHGATGDDDGIREDAGECIGQEPLDEGRHSVCRVAQREFVAGFDSRLLWLGNNRCS